MDGLDIFITICLVISFIITISTIIVGITECGAEDWWDLVKFILQAVIVGDSLLSAIYILDWEPLGSSRYTQGVVVICCSCPSLLWAALKLFHSLRTQFLVSEKVPEERLLDKWAGFVTFVDEVFDLTIGCALLYNVDLEANSQSLKKYIFVATIMGFMNEILAIKTPMKDLSRRLTLMIVFFGFLELMTLVYEITISIAFFSTTVLDEREGLAIGVIFMSCVLLLCGGYVLRNSFWFLLCSSASALYWDRHAANKNPYPEENIEEFDIEL